jgi:hypothetical protein
VDHDDGTDVLRNHAKHQTHEGPVT